MSYQTLNNCPVLFCPVLFCSILSCPDTKRTLRIIRKERKKERKKERWEEIRDGDGDGEVEGGGIGGIYTEDGTVDLRGNPVIRSKRGGWTACSFVVVYEVFERMAYYGISSNLIIYLTTKLRQGTVTSSNNVTNWVGTIWMTPILGAYFADAVLGRYWTFVISASIYSQYGMCLLTLAVSLPGLKPPTCDSGTGRLQESFHLATCRLLRCPLYTCCWNGGTKPNISTIGADQFDDFDPKEKAQKLSFFNWWMLASSLVPFSLTRFSFTYKTTSDGPSVTASPLLAY
ncbi:hypothetical protein OSB04_010395 [Centaurea solstitialis]|uniref:Uncharacterized protein n=1 Tax=Centaurea solstitialis TaxID=347529 RepID=A0AA38TKN7_9ASTR|nr:hypothetical protein OSB04_010395 [Centaurea solstitialis]